MKVAEEDIVDALDHASDFIQADREKFVVEGPMFMKVDRLWHYDDLGSWAEWRAGELAGMETVDLRDELTGFRGPDFAKKALRWIRYPRSMPAVIVIEHPEYTGVADGRGRVSVALGAGLPQIPVAMLRQKQ